MNIEHDYLRLLKDVLDNGKVKEDRTGTGTISVFGRQIRHDMSRGFPLLTTKKMYWKGIVTELLWFLRGDTNIKYLVDNDCHIWDGDAYKSYLKKSKDKVDSNSIPYQNLYLYGTVIDATPENPRQYSKEEFINKIKTNDEFANKWGDLGPVYGKQWADWGGQPGYLETKTITDTNGSMSWPERVGKSNGINQIQNAIDTLKNNPDSRRIMVSAWNVGELDQMTLPPCHHGFQCYVADGKLSLMWNQRSVDIPLGLPFNIASYGTLLLLLCEETGYEPGELIGSLGDCHIYLNQIEGAEEQISRDGFDLPTIKLSNVDILDGEFNYELVNYQSATPIKFPLSN